MHRPTLSTNKTNVLPGSLIIETFTIPPGESHKVLLGTFSLFDAEPKFRNDYHGSSIGSPAVVTHSDVPLEDGGDTYRVYRTFQNFDQVARTITVRFASQADKGLIV